VASLSTDVSGRDSRRAITLLAAMCAVSGLFYGYNLGVIAGAVLFIVDAFHLSADFADAVVSASLLGAMLGAIAGGKLADWLGRRRTVALGGLIGFAGALLATLSLVIDMLVAGRIVVGFSIGMLTCVVPLFIAELSPSHLRGRLGALFSVALTVGLMTAFVSDYAFRDSHLTWRWMFGVGTVPALVLIVIVMTLPESPRWLLVRGLKEKARDVLRRMQGTPDVEDQVAAIEAGLAQQTGRWADLLNPMHRRALVAGLGVAVIRHATGVTLATFWAPELFRLAGFSSRSVDLMGTVGVGVVYVVFGLVGLWFVDRLGRRPLMLWGLAGMFAMLLALAAIFQLSDMSGWAGTLAVAAFFVFVMTFTAGPGVVVFLLISELLPLQIRALGMGIANLVLWGTYLVSTLSFPILIGLIGDGGTFLVYAFFCAAAFLFMLFLVPETKGRSLEEIEAAWRRSERRVND